MGERSYGLVLLLLSVFGLLVGSGNAAIEDAVPTSFAARWILTLTGRLGVSEEIRKPPEAHRLDSARVGIRPNRPSLLSRGKPKPTQHRPTSLQYCWAAGGGRDCLGFENHSCADPSVVEAPEWA